MKKIENNTNLVLEPFKWNGNPPLKISCNTPRFQPFLKPSICCLNSILAPRSSHRHLVDILFQFLSQQRKFKKHVVCVTDTWGCLTDLFSNINTKLTSWGKRKLITFCFLIRNPEKMYLNKLSA